MEYLAGAALREHLDSKPREYLAGMPYLTAQERAPDHVRLG